VVVRIALFEGQEAVGSIEIYSLLVIRPSDYRIDPPGLLTTDEVSQIALELRATSGERAGRIGKYRWVEQRL
jgi:hypothetical protein